MFDWLRAAISIGKISADHYADPILFQSMRFSDKADASFS
jgi:hypothetical protein